jgi:hypothetical protein
MQGVMRIAMPATQESVFFDAGKNLIMYKITLYVIVLGWPLDSHWMEVSLLLIHMN